MSDVTPRQHHDQLIARVEAFFARVQARHGADMQCARGCSDCCHSRFSVTLIEAAVIAEGLASLIPEVRARLAARASSGPADRCPALDDSGSCELYAWRPLICRSHGLPIRQDSPDGTSRDGADRVHLPVVRAIEVCPKNFVGPGRLEAVDAAMILDQTTLSTVLGAIDAAFAGQNGVAPGTRIELDDLLAEPARYFDIY